MLAAGGSGECACVFRGVMLHFSSAGKQRPPDPSPHAVCSRCRAGGFGVCSWRAGMSPPFFHAPPDALRGCSGFPRIPSTPRRDAQLPGRMRRLRVNRTLEREKGDARSPFLVPCQALAWDHSGFCSRAGKGGGEFPAVPSLTGRTTAQTVYAQSPFP